MTATACAVLRHETCSRWIGDLRAVVCLVCDCVYVPDRPDAPLRGSAGEADPSGRPIHQRAPQQAATA